VLGENPAEGAVAKTRHASMLESCIKSKIQNVVTLVVFIRRLIYLSILLDIYPCRLHGWFPWRKRTAVHLVDS